MKRISNFMDSPIKYEEKVFTPDTFRYDSLSPGIYSDEDYQKDLEKAFETKNKFLGLIPKGKSEKETSNSTVEYDTTLTEPRIKGLRNSYRIVKNYLQGLSR